jgi:hypothetical protein
MFKDSACFLHREGAGLVPGKTIQNLCLIGCNNKFSARDSILHVLAYERSVPGYNRGLPSYREAKQ